jgi:hypothetical protein
MLKALTIFAALAAASASVAAPTRLTDVQFMQANRCAALVASPALGGGDASAIKALIKAQRQGRADYIYEKSEQMRDDAERLARHANDTQKARLIAERDSVCQSLAGAASARTAGGGGSATPGVAP